MSWTQPICNECYWRRKGGAAIPEMIRYDTIEETCCDCGKRTQSSIYIRLDPRTVKYPASDE
jgi:hypothetical protein